jgi:hypothetical protein
MEGVKKASLYATSAKNSPSTGPIPLFKTKCISHAIPFVGMGYASPESVEARRVRPDPGWAESVGVGGGQPGSIDMDMHSLAVDKPSGLRPSLGAAQRKAPKTTVTA